MTTSPTCIVVYAGEDDRHRAVRDAAVSIARAAEARLIFYDTDAAPWFVGMGQHRHELLASTDLEEMGRGREAAVVSGARAAGAEAYAWIPDSSDTTALVDYARDEGADLIIMPAGLEQPGFVERLRGKSAYEPEHSGIPVALVDDEGRVTYPQRDGQREHEAGSLEASRRDQQGR